jgi:hypothetical protein
MDANWQNQLKDQMNKSMRNRPMEGLINITIIIIIYHYYNYYYHI